MLLITSGCSFSDNANGDLSWPNFVAETLNVEHTQLATGALGNGLISRKLIHEVSTAENKRDLLVGIMWSGPDRLDAYTEDGAFSNRNDENHSWRGQTVFPAHDTGGWVQMYPGWPNLYSVEYYKTYSNTTWNTIQTYEHIIRTQMFLEKHNVQYFMMPYMDHVLELKGSTPSLRHLWNEINFDTFATTQGCLEWVIEAYGPLEEKQSHPRSFQHEEYVDKVILPYLKERGLYVS